MHSAERARVKALQPAGGRACRGEACGTTRRTAHGLTGLTVGAARPAPTGASINEPQTARSGAPSSPRLSILTLHGAPGSILAADRSDHSEDCPAGPPALPWWGCGATRSGETRSERRLLSTRDQKRTSVRSGWACERHAYTETRAQDPTRAAPACQVCQECPLASHVHS